MQKNESQLRFLVINLPKFKRALMYLYVLFIFLFLLFLFFYEWVCSIENTFSLYRNPKIYSFTLYLHTNALINIKLTLFFLLKHKILCTLK